jgi:hypothetical protein
LPRYISISDILNTASFRDSTNGASKMALYTSFIKPIMNDIKFYVLKSTVTKKYHVDKKNNTVVIPSDCQLISAIGYVDKCGGLQPIYYNKDVPIEMQFEDNIKCDCNCGCDKKCNSVKINQNSIEDIDMGNGITMQKTIHIYTDNNCEIIKKIKEPVSYKDGLDTKFEYRTKIEIVCKLDLKECGCIADTKENKVAVEAACGCIGTFNMTCGQDVCEKTIALGYNISYQGDLIVLPRNYDYDNLVIKYYPLYLNEKDYIIPDIAEEVFMMGFKFYELRNEGKNLNGAQWYKGQYLEEIKKLERRINKISFKKLSDAFGYISAH